MNSAITEVVVTNTIPLNPKPMRQGRKMEERLGPLHCGIDWPGDSGQSRRDFGQQVVCVASVRAPSYEL